jgi:hypothetical protein
MLTACRSGGGAAVRDAQRFDYQTRYRAEDKPGGTLLTVYINARGRPIDRAAVATLDHAVLRGAEAVADDRERRFHRFTQPAEVSTQTDPQTRETYWVARQRVQWLD